MITQKCQSSPSVLGGKSAESTVERSLGFREAMEMAESQMDFRYIQGAEEDVRTVCRAIADVYLLDGDATVMIDGEEMKARALKEAFRQLDERHVCWVLTKISGMTRRIKKMKSYVRTALYNSLIELELSARNDEMANLVEGGAG